MPKRCVWMYPVAALASGLLVALLFPPYGAGWLVWVALVPLLAALWSVGPRRAAWKGFGLGWLGGIAACGIQFAWIGVVSPLGMVVLPLYLGAYWGAFGAMAATLGNPWRGGPGNDTAGRGVWLAVCHGAWWAGLEWLRGWLFTGFGWNALGVALHDTPWLAQPADLLGVGGLSLMVVFFQAVLVQAARRVARRQSLTAARELAVASGALALAVGYSGFRLHTEGRGEAARLKALLVQINIPQDAAQVLWDALDVHLAYEEETGEALDALKQQGRWPDWVVWPESALTGRFLRTADDTWGTWRENEETIGRVRQYGPFQLLFGTNELEAEMTGDDQLVVKDRGRVWNSLAVMSPANELQTFRKHHLVIFGETIPFADRIPMLRKLYEQQAGVEYGGSFTPGVSFDPLPVPTAKGVTIGAIPTVCFEDTVPRLTRHFVRPGPQVIVNVTNDGWFKESPASAQHFVNAKMRAIELRRPMLRCANTGVSAAIDTTGSVAHPDTGAPQVLVDDRGSHFTRGWLLAELDVPLRPSFSLYAAIGDWGIITLALGTWVIAGRGRKQPAAVC